MFSISVREYICLSFAGEKDKLRSITTASSKFKLQRGLAEVGVSLGQSMTLGALHQYLIRLGSPSDQYEVWKGGTL